MLRPPTILHDTRGTSVMEFALALPLLVLLFTGGFQLNDGIAAYRKLTVSTRTIVDLTSQFSSLDNDQLDAILGASRQVMAPYSTVGATMMVTQIKIDGNKVATVDWSRAKGVTALTAGTPYDLPESIRQPNTYMLVASMTYTYKPTFAQGLIGTIPLSETIIMSPRVSDRVIKE